MTKQASGFSKNTTIPLFFVCGNGLIMHYCDSNHEATRMQQEKKQQH